MAEDLCRQIISLIAFLAEQHLSEVNPWFTDEINCSTGVIVSRCTAALQQKRHLQFDPEDDIGKESNHIIFLVLCSVCGSLRLSKICSPGLRTLAGGAPSQLMEYDYKNAHSLWYFKSLLTQESASRMRADLIFKAEVKCKGKSNRLHDSNISRDSQLSRFKK